jgi:hypothetical protein
MPKFGVVFAEKVLGILLLAIGLVLTYETYGNQSVAGNLGSVFLLVGVVMAAFGVILILAKTE